MDETDLFAGIAGGLRKHPPDQTGFVLLLGYRQGIAGITCLSCIVPWIFSKILSSGQSKVLGGLETQSHYQVLERTQRSLRQEEMKELFLQPVPFPTNPEHEIRVHENFHSVTQGIHGLHTVHTLGSDILSL